MATLPNETQVKELEDVTAVTLPEPMGDLVVLAEADGDARAAIENAWQRLTWTTVSRSSNSARPHRRNCR